MPTEPPIRRFFGWSVATRFRFHIPLPMGERPAGLSFDVRAGPLEPPAETPAYESPARDPSGESVLRFHLLADGGVLRFAGQIEFRVEGSRIVSRAAALTRPEWLEALLLGSVAAFVLERDGRPALHASAVEVEDRAVLFLAGNGGGKSALAAEFLRAGHALLADDVSALSGAGPPVCRAAYPAMRMDADEADHFLGGHDSLSLVHPRATKRWVPLDGRFGRFRDAELPVARLFLPRREDGGEVRVEDVSPTDAVLELARHSFHHRLIEALGWQAQRLPALARIVRGVPARRLVYPSGFEHLPRVRDAVLEDLARGP